MAATLAIEAHGSALRLAAEISGFHFQGLAALAGCLRKRGCSDRRLLRRLSALDAAVGLLRHITVVSIQDFEKDLKLELAKMAQMDTQNMEQAADAAPDGGPKMEHTLVMQAETFEQLGAQVVDPHFELQPDAHPDFFPHRGLGGARP